MKNRMTRRDFLGRTAAAAVAGPFVVRGSALGANGKTAPSDRINIAAIGMGGRGRQVLGHFLDQSDVQCVAICDCFEGRRVAGKRMVDDRHGNTDCATYRFHEEVFGRDDIDAVVIATGDRWHAVLSVLSSKAGKDVYCEKPSCLTIREGRALVDAMKEHETVWQCGTQRRSNNSYRFVAEAVQSGKIGNLHTITTLLGRGFTRNGVEKPDDAPAPEVFDYDRWMGQAPLAPYSEVRVKMWRQHWTTGAGLIGDMGPHFFDTAQWAHNSEMDGPSTFEGKAVWPPQDMFAQTPYDFNLVAQYKDGVKLIIQKGDKGLRFEGDEGWIHITDGGALSAEPQSILTERKIDEQSWRFMDGHIRNFLDCVRSRGLTASHPELAQRNHTICHCANICLQLGRRVEFDPMSERFVNDDEANSMLGRTMRAPWRI